MIGAAKKKKTYPSGTVATANSPKKTIRPKSKDPPKKQQIQDYLKMKQTLVQKSKVEQERREKQKQVKLKDNLRKIQEKAKVLGSQPISRVGVKKKVGVTKESDKTVEMHQKYNNLVRQGMFKTYQDHLKSIKKKPT